MMEQVLPQHHPQGKGIPSSIEAKIPSTTIKYVHA